MPPVPRRFELIVFDWDGTLVDSTRIIVDSIQSASVDAGLPVPDATSARGIIGLSLQEAVSELFADISPQQLQLLIERYRHYYFAGDHEIPLFPEVAEAMAELNAQGCLLAVATGKGRRGLESSFEQTGLRPQFIASRCADECFSKPHPQMLLELMHELGVLPQATLMVGDTHYDLQMAANAGVSSLAVTYGAQPLESLLPHAPLASFDSFAKLRAWLNENA